MQRAGKVAAQAQAVREAQITAQESMELTKALLRVAVHHVSYLRGIFPEDNYRKVDMKNLDNMEVYMLDPKCEEAKRLQAWVAGGVGDALERRYLRKVFFGFSRDKMGKDLLEEYVFTFTYDDTGEVHMAAGGRSTRGKHKFSTKEGAPARRRGPTLSKVKYQVCRLMRMLVEVTNTLEQVPDERYLFMKLAYTEDTPEEYEPPMFGPAPDGGLGCFSRMPFVMEVGKVEGLNIKCGLAVKSLLDTVDGWADEEDMPVADDNSNLFQHTSTPQPSSSFNSGRDSGAEEQSLGGGFSCAGNRAAKRWTPVKDGDEVNPRQQPEPASPGEVGMTVTARPASATANEPHRQQVAEVEAWVLGRPMAAVHILDALARFSHLPSFDVDACFAILQRRGVLLPAGEDDNYHVIKPVVVAAEEELAARAETQAEPQAAAKPAMASPAPSAAATALLEAEEAMERLVVGMHSQQGGLHEAPGSQATVSVAGKRARVEQEESVQPPQVLFPDSQELSQLGVKRRKKASIVDAPIQQGGSQRKATTTAVAPRRSARHLH